MSVQHTTGAWSLRTNEKHWKDSDEEAIEIAVKNYVPVKSFRKDYLGYCRLLGIIPHPKLCPRLDEVDKDLLNQRFDDSDVQVIKVRNWMLDTPNLRAMNMSLQACSSIMTIELFNASLTVDQLQFVCSKLPLTSVQTLQLEWNEILPTDDPTIYDHTTCFASLLSERSSLTHLSLRANGITAKGAACLADALAKHRKILVLNLFRNYLKDEGAQALANALSENKTLQHLSVANNGITAHHPAGVQEDLKALPVPTIVVKMKRASGIPPNIILANRLKIIDEHLKISPMFL